MGAVPSATADVILLYDGWCGICTRCVAWLRARDPDGRVLALPNQTPGLKERLGLSRRQVDTSVWAVTRDGRYASAAAAINVALAHVRRPWPWVAWLYRVPPIGWAEERCYAWFAPRRGRFARWGVLPGCDHEGVPCTPEGDSS